MDFLGGLSAVRRNGLVVEDRVFCLLVFEGVVGGRKVWSLFVSGFGRFGEPFPLCVFFLGLCVLGVFRFGHRQRRITTRQSRAG